ncbi:PTS system mannose/fructose/sorbose family transporter subunit IID, partial [Enterococcus sp. S181_ASV_20]|nr:PTS system mannose/fructose/sorbose family transporter subunit IID [Enterococcus sp. S181_ASV_20]
TSSAASDVYKRQTLLVWWMLKKKINTLYIIIAIFVVGILSYYLGILGYAG